MSLRRLVLFWGKRMCLYSRHASRCIMATIVSGLRWSASSLSAEEYNFNWPQLVSCRAGGACFLLWVIKGCAKITRCYIGVGENCNILYTTCSPSHYKIDTCWAFFFFLWTRRLGLTAQTQFFNLLAVGCEAVKRRASYSVNALMELF